MPHRQRLLALPPEVAHGAGGDALDHGIGVVGGLEQGREGREGIGAPILERARRLVAEFAVTRFERPDTREGISANEAELACSSAVGLNLRGGQTCLQALFGNLIGRNGGKGESAEEVGVGTWRIPRYRGTGRRTSGNSFSESPRCNPASS